MKFIKTTTAILIATTMGVTAMAQKISSTQVPAAVKASFKKAYPTVKTSNWEKEKNNFETGFMQNSTEMSAVFNADGTQLESEKSIKTSELPTNVLSYIKQNYKGVAIKESAKITNTNTGEITYEAEVKGKDLLFDNTGKFIKIAED